MGVGLGGIGDTSGGETERINGPSEVVIPIGTTERKLNETDDRQLIITGKTSAVHIHLHG